MATQSDGVSVESEQVCETNEKFVTTLCGVVLAQLMCHGRFNRHFGGGTPGLEKKLKDQM